MRTLAEPAVRDLAWAIGSPGLLDPGFPAYSEPVLDDAFCTTELLRADTWLHGLDRDPAELHAFLEKRPTHRLGHYFESLLEYWLKQAGAAELRARLPVGDTGHRIGEFDFVFRKDDWGGSLHWEAAVKFYLQQSPAPEWNAFIGPNPRDRLSDKLHKLFHQQLKLGATTAGRAALGMATSPAPRAWVKGYLFFPAGTQPPSVPGISNHCLKGWWLRHGERPLPAHHAALRWKSLPRLGWLAPARASAADLGTLLDTEHMHTVIARHFAHSHTPLLLAELAPDGDGTWHEIARGFVVNPQWPQPSRP